jgi:hypothetical protein
VFGQGGVFDLVAEEPVGGEKGSGCGGDFLPDEVFAVEVEVAAYGVVVGGGGEGSGSSSMCLMGALRWTRSSMERSR